MQILSHASVKGDGAVNEDIAGAAGSMAWIFDGATATGAPAIPGAGSDAEWLVRRLDGAIRGLAGQDTTDVPLTEVASRLIDDVRRGLRELGLTVDRVTPYASGALLRMRPGWADYLVLGDVTLTFRAGRRSEVVTDPQAARLASAAIDIATRYQGAELRDRQREFERMFVNQPGGYWVFGSQPGAIGHAVAGRFRLDGSCLALLATDGFARVVEGFDLAASWPALVDGLAAGGPGSVASMIARLRMLEADAGHAGVARIKESDDATGLLLRIGEPA
jgi:hypothetical protein